MHISLPSEFLSRFMVLKLMDELKVDFSYQMITVEMKRCYLSMQPTDIDQKIVPLLQAIYIIKKQLTYFLHFLLLRTFLIKYVASESFVCFLLYFLLL